MRPNFIYILILGFFMSLFTFHSAKATHMKGGEITVRRISNTALTYEFTLTIYCEYNPAWQQQREVLFCFGDGLGSKVSPRSNGGGLGEDIGNGTWKGIYKATYTYAAPSNYKVNIGIQNRNANVRNIPNSDQISFYVETIFKIDPGLGLNSTPLLLNPAVDLTAIVGQKFIHNPNAVDPEGDSLAYRLIDCRLGEQQTCVGRGAAIPGFRQPNLVAASPSSFTINARTGDLIWNTPQEVGLYNCAFVIEEWRNGVKISETVRDMQIEVKDADNKAPVIKVPDDICVEAGTLIQETISADDTPASAGRKDPLNLFSTGSVYRSTDPNVVFAQPYATFTAAARQNPIATGVFRWQTSCAHIKEQPYDVLFKVEDLPPGYDRNPPLIPKLVDSKIWRIKVVAPRVKNLKAVPDAGNRSITLTWDSYTCQNAGAELIIYRKVGCDNFVPDKCQTGIPAGLGYVEVARVPISATTYIDKNLKRNTDYSYRLVASFAAPLGGKSVASDQICARLESQMPVITNVTVDKTSTTDGEITVKWTRPIDFNPALFKGPYQYRLFKATGVNSNTFTQVSGNVDADLSGTKADTVFVDTKLNTQDNVYRYRLLFYYTSDTGLTLLDSTEASNSVRLTTTADVRKVTLSWQANVAWSNENQTHRIYRETRPGSGVFTRIADVAVQGASTFTFSDDGQDRIASDGTFNVKMSPDSSYCYKVETVGSYNAPKVKPNLLYNFSQISCATPKSDIVPCPPVLNIDLLDCDAYTKDDANCEVSTFKNILTWTSPDKQANGSDCDKDIVKYTLYYASSADGTFTKLADITSPTPPATTYTHLKNDSFIGCYYVTSTNKYGTESAKSNTVCKDNCPSFSLPNVFTPNGDGKNDTFQALKCPRFVQTLTFVVYNRNGQKVYEYTGPKLEWDGKDSSGKDAPAGTYFYNCNVSFQTLEPSKASLSLKGYIELLR
ncbi:T9SS type B sorting domain-containing protein [Flectobacillus major]|uniref:T9SS type B sorting domain-containing protein n=1 Tax=Flectobacillus major TaxID=103 RepID=UPI0005C5CAC5|nr:gliding motility-associated C-terminal domain-containing protein [Flectobacillus major]